MEVHCQQTRPNLYRPRRPVQTGLYIGDDRHGRERLLRYCVRPPFLGERPECIAAERARYHLPKPRSDGRTELILSPPQLAGIDPLVQPQPEYIFDQRIAW